MKRGETDWTDGDLKRAAVEYCLQEVRDLRGAEREGKVVEVAGALGCEVRALRGWLADDDLRPRGGVSGAGTGAGGDDEGAGAGDGTEEAVESVWGGADEDALGQLLRRESDALSGDEREALIGALEAGEGLSRAQRLAIAVELRAVAGVDRVAVVRGIVDFLVPGRAVGRAWRVKETSYAVPRGGGWEERDLRHGVLGYPRLGRSLLLVREAGGRVRHAVPYATVRREAGGLLYVRRLVPAGVFAEPLVARRMALLSSAVRVDGMTGKGWAALFGQTDANVSLDRKRIAKGLGGARGVRNKGQSNRGVRRGIVNNG